MVMVIAHRGFSGNYPENTMAAFQAAVSLQVDMVEFDVRLCRDGLVVMHDATVDRTTNGTGKVAEMTLAELKALDAGSRHPVSPRKQQIPTLAEVLQFMGSAMPLNIHVKSDGGSRRSEAVALVARELARYQLHPASLVAGDEQTLAAFRQVEESFPINLLDPKDNATYVRRALDLGCRYIQPRNNTIDQKLVAEAQAHGLKVIVFRANEPREMRRLISLGVDGILTDYPDILLKIRAAADDRANAAAGER
ncbi:MAG TPA: hypothetical protein GXX29_00750 [Firmicutes bacterium]|nr:hypothetical protein [Bacillota bacterium]